MRPARRRRTPPSAPPRGFPALNPHDTLLRLRRDRHGARPIAPPPPSPPPSRARRSRSATDRCVADGAATSPTLAALNAPAGRLREGARSACDPPRSPPPLDELVEPAASRGAPADPRALLLAPHASARRLRLAACSRRSHRFAQSHASAGRPRIFRCRRVRPRTPAPGRPARRSRVQTRGRSGRSPAPLVRRNPLRRDSEPAPRAARPWPGPWPSGRAAPVDLRQRIVRKSGRAIRDGPRAAAASDAVAADFDGKSPRTPPTTPRRSCGHGRGYKRTTPYVASSVSTGADGSLETGSSDDLGLDVILRGLRGQRAPLAAQSVNSDVTSAFYASGLHVPGPPAQPDRAPGRRLTDSSRGASAAACALAHALQDVSRRLPRRAAGAPAIASSVSPCRRPQHAVLRSAKNVERLDDPRGPRPRLQPNVRTPRRVRT